MDWERSLSRGHLSPHFRSKRVSVGRQGGCGLERDRVRITTLPQYYKEPKNLSRNYKRSVKKTSLLTRVFTMSWFSSSFEECLKNSRFVF